MSKTWGITRKIAIWMYKTVSMPQILYASVVWWPMVNVVAIRNLLLSLQDSYLKAAVEFMKMNPTEPLAVPICLTPLDTAVFGEARIPAYRLNCQGEWRNTGLRYMKLEFLQKYSFTLRQDTILKKISW
jgi:hypothetical protein